jgi:hypothetical protein
VAKNETKILQQHQQLLQDKIDAFRITPPSMPVYALCRTFALPPKPNRQTLFCC